MSRQNKANSSSAESHVRHHTSACGTSVFTSLNITSPSRHTHLTYLTNSVNNCHLSFVPSDCAIAPLDCLHIGSESLAAHTCYCADPVKQPSFLLISNTVDMCFASSLTDLNLLAPYTTRQLSVLCHFVLDHRAYESVARPSSLFQPEIWRRADDVSERGITHPMIHTCSLQSSIVCPQYRTVVLSKIFDTCTTPAKCPPWHHGRGNLQIDQ